LKIATWNVNSLRVRLPDVLTWVASARPDVLALQETKLEDQHFPVEELRAAGYHLAYAGQKTYNGVALLSKTKLHDIATDIPSLVDPQRRILAATVGGIRIINLYVPNGESVDSDKYRYKLDWLAKVTEYIRQELLQHSQLVVLGDFNIAPEDRDVHEPLAWQGHVLVSELERKAWRHLLATGLHDAFRLFNQPPASFSWWDYRKAAFQRNAGLRIDHVLLSQALVPRCQTVSIDKTPRKAERPSDHTPVVVEIAPAI
jgi:exodeoxyribonuclease-3